MKFKPLFLAVVIVVLQACSPNKPPSVTYIESPKQPDPTKPAGETVPAPPTTDPAKSPEQIAQEAKANEMKKMLERMPKAGPEPSIAPTATPRNTVKTAGGIPQETLYEVPGQGTDGWAKSTMTGEQLGVKLDEGMKTLSGVYGEAIAATRDSEMQGSTKSEIWIQDASHYKVEFNIPEKPTEANFMMGAGQARGTFINGTWKSDDLPDAPAALDDRISHLGSLAFFPLVDQKPMWSVLLKQLTAGEQGFRAIVEEKLIPVGTEERIFYRVLAERKGEKPATAEIRVDGKRFLPVTVRLNRALGSKKNQFMQWNAQWSFTRPIDPGTFKVPSTVK
ncbi:MAG: hypothetical protein K8R88_07365 [Armatimonadetes bacterium]|nr:hypothetical protein [Armatimonadota bacterium]